MALAVKAVDVAIPLESVVSDSVAFPFANVPLAPELGAVKVTVTPLTGDPFWSTTADKGRVKAVPTSAVCSDPFCAFTTNTGAAVFAKPKFTEADCPEAVAVAVTAYSPVMEFAVNLVEVANPLESVVSDSVAFPFANVPLAPEDGAVKITDTPLAGDPPMLAFATRGAPNAAPTTAACPDPLLTDTLPDNVEDEFFEAMQPERRRIVATQLVSNRMSRIFPLSAAIHWPQAGELHRAGVTPATTGVIRTKPRRLMGCVLWETNFRYVF